ncbi:MAG: hypothetical protein IKF90_23910 [Parasporobacterium sp.]|jgi:hypothetical protein|nr:hypothetical protein [Parasporobacterium sp.]
MKKIATTVLFFIIALSSTGCGQKNVIGTYCTGEGLSREDVYVSLLSDNTFLIYRQLETGLPGEFDSEEFENFTALTFHLEDGRQLLAAYDKQNSLVFVGEFINDISCPLELKRISSIPININVSGNP